MPVQLRRRYYNHRLQGQHLQDLARHLHVWLERKEIEHKKSAVDGNEQDQASDYQIQAQARGVGRGLLTY